MKENHSSPLIDRVRDTLRRRIALAGGARVVAAVSGGSDSVALALLLHELDARGVLTFAGIAHLHHQLRGHDANDDLIFCQDLAARLGVPFEEANADVAAEAEKHGESIEAAGRRSRYEFFEYARLRLLATHVATGHTVDDQAETVLLRLMRGAGARGLSGIRPVRDTIIRPIIECRRDDLRAFLADRGQAFRHDSTNDDRSIPRNRLRHDVLPLVVAAAPGAVDAMARTAQLAADDEEFLLARAIEATPSVVLTSSGDDFEIASEVLNALPAALARRVVRGALEHTAGERRAQLTAAHIEVVRTLAETGEGSADLPGVRVEWREGRLGLHAQDGMPDTDDRVGRSFSYDLDVPGSVIVTEAHIVISAARDQTAASGVERNEAASPVRTARRVEVDARSIRLPLTVRNRRPGDRIKPIGAIGRKKLQDLMVDAKIPRSVRDRVPVVVDAAGQVVWVVGVTLADECRVVAPDAKVVVLTAEGR